MPAMRLVEAEAWLGLWDQLMSVGVGKPRMVME